MCSTSQVANSKNRREPSHRFCIFAFHSATAAAVNPGALVAAGAIATRRKRVPAVKILGNGDLSKKLTVTGCTVSASAKEKIEKAGGSVA